MSEKKSFVFYKGWLPLFEGMTDEQAGQLFKAICSYQSGNDSRPQDPLLGAIYDMMRNQFIEDDKKYQETCLKNAENGRKGGRPKKQTESEKSEGFLEEPRETERFLKKAKKADKDKDKDKDKDINIKVASAPRFVKPSVDEVRDYCKERGNNVNPESFVDFYESKGWKVGSNPMKDWKACVRTWEQRHKSELRPVRNSFNNFQQNTYTSAEMSELEKQLLEN